MSSETTEHRRTQLAGRRDQVRAYIATPAFRKSAAIAIVLAILLIGVSLLTNRQYLGWGLLGILGVLAWPIPRFRSFLVALIPYTGVWFIFTFLRSFADETILAETLNTHVAAFERWLFGGELPTIRLQARFYEIGNLQAWDYYLTFIHWSYFIVPHAVVLYLWWKHPRRFRHYLSAMTLMLTIGVAIYFIIPTNPPWMAPEALNTPGAPYVIRIMEPIGQQLGGGLYQAGYEIVGESNPIAAMPSIHFAVTFLLVWVARDTASRFWQIITWLYVLSMGLALVYLGEHYIVDLVVGALITSYAWIAAHQWFARVAPLFITRAATKAAPSVPATEKAAD